MNALVKFSGFVLFVYGAYMLYGGGMDYGQLAITVAGFALFMVDFDRRKLYR